MPGMEKIPTFPNSAPVSLELQSQLDELLANARDRLSDYTFASLFLFRHKYQYQVALTSDGELIISGVHSSPVGLHKFFMTPLAFPDQTLLTELFDSHDYWRGITNSMLDSHRREFGDWGIEVTADRDDFDYVYLRSDLAELHGDKYQKKRNQINGFEKEYDCEVRPLTADQATAARSVLDAWCAAKGSDADYLAAVDAIELQAELGLFGRIYFAGGQAIGWWLGEIDPGHGVFVDHFEKGSFDHPGIYQFMNRDMAASLPASVTYINREQDLGDEGLRHAKMSYHPVEFIEKYVGTRSRR